MPVCIEEHCQVDPHRRREESRPLLFSDVLAGLPGSQNPLEARGPTCPPLVQHTDISFLRSRVEWRREKKGSREQRLPGTMRLKIIFSQQNKQIHRERKQISNCERLGLGAVGSGRLRSFLLGVIQTKVLELAMVAHHGICQSH